MLSMCKRASCNIDGTQSEEQHVCNMDNRLDFHGFRLMSLSNHPPSPICAACRQGILGHLQGRRVACAKNPGSTSVLWVDQTKLYEMIRRPSPFSS